MQYSIDRFADEGEAGSHAGPPTQERLRGLDGLRAVAVIAVFLYHADLDWVRGGYLGVDLFFVISGFLITHLLAAESERTGRLDLVQFYWRRAKRLLPASWLMTAGVVVAAALLAPDALARLRADALASLAYVTNWELLSAKASYFESFGRQPLLLHLWSLAIEEQFYILWAPVLLFALPRLGRRRLAFWAALLAAVLVLWTAALAGAGGHPGPELLTRLHFGTDTHGYPLLIGAVLGLLWRPDQQPHATRPAVSDGVFTLGLLALGSVIVVLGRLGEETAWLYPWGVLLAALASAALIAAATYRGSGFGRWLDQQPLRWIGERSYGIYLWHWPIFMLTRPADLPLNPGLTLALRIVLTLAISALSYRYVESPIRHGLLERIWAGLKTPGRRLAAFGQGALVALTIAAVVTPAAAVLRDAPAQASPASDVRAALGLAETKPPPKPVKARVVIAPPAIFTGQDVTAIGDSVLLGSARMVKQKLGGTRIYATVGWQAADVLNQVRSLAQARALTPVVLIHLGTNGYVYEDQLRAILAPLADRKRVILVNTHVPRRWMKPNNDLIARVLPDYPNVVLVNWRDASQNHREYFVSDDCHLTVPGQRAFIGEIMRVGHLVKAPDKAAPAAPPAVDPASDLGAAPGDKTETLARNP